MDRYKIKSTRWTDHPTWMTAWSPKMDGFKISPKSGRIILQGWPLEVHNGRIQNKVHKMDGSSYMDDNLKSKNGRIILQGWPLDVQNGRIQNKVHKMDGSSYMDDNLKSKNGRIILQGGPLDVQNGRIQNKIHKMDGSSYEVDNLKSKMDGYKIKSTRWTDHPRRMTTWSPKWTDIK